MSTLKFEQKLFSIRRYPIRARGLNILQINLGYRCNMACRHCHVAGGPDRTEVMDEETVEQTLRVFLDNPIETLDITGGAPELNPHFRMLVAEAKKAGRTVIVHTNLTVFFEEGMVELPDFYRDHKVELVASLPCYGEDNVTVVRGKGAFQKSIDALRRLNSLGFGDESAERPLSLVYNPGGPFLPPPQAALEADYKRELKNRYGLSFTRLYAFANMPIGRFRRTLAQNGACETYHDMLASAFNPATLDNVMCRQLVSVGWDGSLYDCDFNQAIGLTTSSDAPRHIKDFDYKALACRRIAMDDHCYGCTAGQGST